MEQHLITFNVLENGNDFVRLSMDFQSQQNREKKEEKKKEKV